MRILILKPSSLGDVVQALPVLRLLRLRFPGSEIYWWIDSSLAPLLDGDRDLSGLILFERRRWSSPLYWDEIVASIQRLRRMRFDWVVDLQSLLRSGVFAWLANGGLSIGLDDRREGAAAFYDIAVPRASVHTHAVDWYLDVLRRLDVPVHWEFDWLPCREEVAAGVRRKWDLDPAKWVALQPGARWANKRWPAESFADLVRRWSADEPNTRFAILGGNDDAGLGAILTAAAPKQCLDLTNRTTLPEMVEWIRLCSLMIANDTGPMHVAAALGKPLVALFGPTEPRRTGPYRQMDRVIQLRSLPCVPCMKDSCAYHKPFECLRGISPSVVYARVREIRDRAKPEA